jgi:hypothetical protein
MEADVLWKAAMRPRLPTGLGKRPPTTTRVFHISHSPCHKKRRDKGEPKPKPFIKSVTYVPGPTCYLCSRLHMAKPDEGGSYRRAALRDQHGQ